MAARFHKENNKMPSGYRVIYPKGERNKLDVAWVVDYEEDDWAIASRQNFDDDKTAAIEYAMQLAEQHNLEYVGEAPYGGRVQHYLD